MTVLELLLDYLPDKYVDCVVNNLTNRKVLHEQGYNIEMEMMSLFDWSDSNEGYEFWDQVFRYILGEASLPPMPINISYRPSEFIYANDMMYLMNAGGTNINIKMDIDLKELMFATNKLTKDRVYSWLN